jgi:hypothetical protein
MSDVLAEITHQRWAAVFLDCPGLPWNELQQRHRELGGLEYRFYDREAGPEQVSANKLPVYNLRSAAGTVGPRDTKDLSAYMTRLAMLKRAPANLHVLTVGIDDSEGASGLVEALEVNAAAFKQLIAIGGSGTVVAQLRRWSTITWRIGAAWIDWPHDSCNHTCCASGEV